MFMMPLHDILKIKLQLQKMYRLQEETIDKYPFWMLEENIKIVDELNDEERKAEEEQQKQQNANMPDYNMSNAMNNANNMMNNVPKFK